MFKELGQLAGLIGKLPQIKEEMARFQDNLGTVTAEGDAGAGMVKVRVNGKMQVLACTLSDEAWELDDREMFEDLIKSATNAALDNVRQQVAEETQKMASNLGLPTGMGLPGLG
jgi:DNA-binding YbaB/EbfC family protein